MENFAISEQTKTIWRRRKFAHKIQNIYDADIFRSSVGATKHDGAEYSPYSFPVSDAVMKRRKKSDLIFANTDIVSAIRKYVKAGERSAVLSFSNFTAPGKDYANGGDGQEAALCEGSDLYNVLKEFSNRNQSWLNWNKNFEMHNGLFSNRGIYFPDIVFFGDPDVFADVISLSAPDCMQNDGMAALGTLDSRAKFLSHIADTHGVDTLFLGAWGCGQMGFPPSDVAHVLLKTFSVSTVDRVVFAVPGSGETSQIFESAIESVAGTNLRGEQL